LVWLLLMLGCSCIRKTRELVNEFTARYLSGDRLFVERQEVKELKAGFAQKMNGCGRTVLST
jgi:hypothetical protein